MKFINNKKLVLKFEKTYTIHEKRGQGRKSTENEKTDAVTLAIEKTESNFGSTSMRAISSASGISKSLVSEL